ncbi:hypothetical protein CK203_062540 [Vitis vinifera]|uniref:Uncharacterized protein n=1 Tax=Vitis vinifera TaxID=29760 RepID=A0A438FWS2_VITVI|nr:hypothetical protein CK203_062540 [Vitis vinifera]
MSISSSIIFQAGCTPNGWVITFPPLDPNRLNQPIAAINIQTDGILTICPKESQADTIKIQRSLNNFPGRRRTTCPSWSVIQNVHFSMVEDLSPFNTIMECTDSYPIGVSADSCQLVLLE